MSKPRDHHIVDRVGLVWAARLFSNVVSPPVMFAVLGLTLALHGTNTILAGLAWAAVYGFFVALAPILFVLQLLQRGRIVELHMTDTRERHLPYLVAVLMSLLVLALILILDGPPLLFCLALFNVLTLSVLGVVNVRWLVSFHATAVSAFVTIITLVFGPVAGLLTSPLVPLVVTVRLYLRRHTVAQMIGGLLWGAGSVLLLWRLGCFV